MFTEVSVRHHDIFKINQSYDFSNVEYHQTNVNGAPIRVVQLSEVYSEMQLKNELGEPTHKSGITSNDIHDLLRKLTLSVFGKKKNSELIHDEYDMAIDFYNQLKESWLLFYNLRLSQIQEKQIED